jgi:ribosomal protein S18 acetylase RimI-like enzyme
VTQSHVPAPAPGIVVRRAELEDADLVLESVLELAKASTTAARWSGATFYPYLAKEAVSGVLQAQAMFLACANKSKAATTTAYGANRIAKADNIVGFAAYSAIMTVDAGESTLENMVVAKPWQRQGIGWRLLSAGLFWCRAHASETVFLEVRESNRAAIGLYERAGFSSVGNRPGYYSEPAEDGVQMRRSLRLVDRVR